MKYPVILLFLVACAATQRTETVIEPDAERACANLRRPEVHCPEGFGSAGGVSCAEIVSRRHALMPLPLTCWANATSAPEAMGCGSLRCIR